MHLSVVPWLIRLLMPAELIWRGKGKHTIYLTFDDGPIPEVTPRVLEILDRYRIKATFFCVGENVSKHPDIYEMVLAHGHATGNHTFHHLKGWKTEQQTYLDDVRHCSEFVKSNLLRPPYGRIAKGQIMQLKDHYKIIMYSVLTGDYDKRLRKERVLNNALRYTRSGSIVVFHDSLKAADRMLYALPLFIEYFLKKGYTFEKLS